MARNKNRTQSSKPPQLQNKQEPNTSPEAEREPLEQQAPNDPPVAPEPKAAPEAEREDKPSGPAIGMNPPPKTFTVEDILPPGGGPKVSDLMSMGFSAEQAHLLAKAFEDFEAQVREIMRPRLKSSACFRIGSTAKAGHWRHGRHWPHEKSPVLFQPNDPVLADAELLADLHNDPRIVVRAPAGYERHGDGYRPIQQDEAEE